MKTVGSRFSGIPLNFTPNFSKLIKAPENLKKKLDFVGLIEEKSDVLKIQSELKPGQIIVSISGEIWRWDGYISKGKQNSSTKAVLEQLKNRRLKQLSKEEKVTHLQNLEEELQRHLRTRVEIKFREGKGQIKIDYFSLEEFERIYDLLTTS